MYGSIESEASEIINGPKFEGSILKIDENVMKQQY
jgi:hypothetical protein